MSNGGKGWCCALALRPLALQLLGDGQLVAPSRVGFAVVAGDGAAGRSDSARFRASLFAAIIPASMISPAATTAASITAGASLWPCPQPEPVRRPAAAYLKTHHPKIGPSDPGTRALNIKPGFNRRRLSIEPTTTVVLRPTARPAPASGRHRTRERAWNEPTLLYRLADSEHREPRAFAIEQLLHLGARLQSNPPCRWIGYCRNGCFS